MTERPTLRHVYDANHDPLFILPKRPRTIKVELWSFDCYTFCATTEDGQEFELDADAVMPMLPEDWQLPTTIKIQVVDE